MTTTTTTWTLSGFGDEIAPEPEIQLAVLEALGARHIEVRSAWGVNVDKFTDAQQHALVDVIAGNGFRVSAIASSIGKVSLSTPPATEIARLTRVIEHAHALGTRYIRVFSFWQEGQDPTSMRQEVIERLGTWASLARSEGIVLVHENEKDIFGDTPDRVLGLVSTVDSPALRVAWDSANFVQVGVRPFTDAYRLLRPYLEYLQVKDARFSDNRVTVAGDGDGELLLTLAALRDDGYQGFISLEPHLSAAHSAGGFSGPEAFGRAGRALRKLTDQIGVTLR